MEEHRLLNARAKRRNRSGRWQSDLQSWHAPKRIVQFTVEQKTAQSMTDPSLTPAAPADPHALLGDGPRDELEKLMVAIGEGHSTALAELYDATVGKVHALVRAIVRTPEDAEEVTCDVYTQVWQGAHRFSASRGSAMAWLLTIARSRALDCLRRRNHRERLLAEEPLGEDGRPSADDDLPEEILHVFQTGSAVHAALKTLPPDRRRIVGLAFFRDLSHAEIAEVTGLPLGTVKSCLRRTLMGLREALEERDSL